MNKKIIAASTLAALLASPAFILAFSPGNIPNTVNTLTVGSLVDIIFSILWPIAVAFFIIMFILAAFQFATAQGDPGKLQAARSSVIFGVVGVVVALVAWSLVAIVRNMIGGV